MENRLGYLDDAERLRAYEAITNGCMHLWSKGKLMDGNTCPHCGQTAPKEYTNNRRCGSDPRYQHETPDRLSPVLNLFAELAEKDPLFLAHFTGYAVQKLKAKDLQVVSTFINSLSDADGTPFSVGSSYLKPNWRIVSQAALQQLDPPAVLRVVRLANKKMPIGSKRTVGTHMSKTLKTALRKYLRYREANPKMLMGARKAGMSEIMRNLYRIASILPSAEACRILNWKQREGCPGYGVERDKSVFDFAGLSDIQIAEKIRSEKLPPTGVLGALPDKITPVIAASILEQASGDQAIVLTEMFEDQGLLKNKEVRAVYQEKVKTAKTALDRVERIKSKMDKEVEDILKSAKSDKRKEDVGNLGKVFLHLDVSGSMHDALRIATDRGATIAECIKNPEENFHWGTFNEAGKILDRPKTFEKDAFAHALYGVRAGGGTNCLALYREARRLGCDTDIYVTDEEHTGADLGQMIDHFRKAGVADPKKVVIIHVGSKPARLKSAFESKGIPVATLKPEQLAESALVTQAIRASLTGAPIVIEEIMGQGLLSLPKWWESVASK